MGKCKCINCGKKYDYDKTAEEFNDYFNGSHDYSMDGWEGYCADCAISGQDEADFSGEDDDDIPVGCAACGGNYPHCVDSCKLFDD